MIKRTKTLSNKNLILILFIIYQGINLIYLTRFPFVHSDESWLGGLSRNIIQSGDYSVTETFFDLKVRHPHAIKIIFHTIQILFIKILGYRIFTLRLISVLFGALCLIYFFKLCKQIFDSRKSAFTAAMMLSLDVQFVYASHFARQEIILLFVLIFSLYYVLKHFDQKKPVHDIILGCIIGLSIGLHPNSFIISLPFVLIYLYNIFITKKMKLLDLLRYCIVTGTFALGFILLSLYFDPDFIKNYAAYGNEFEVFNPVTSKIAEVKYFYLKLFYGVSGTYYTPNIKLELLGFFAALLLSIFKLLTLDSSSQKQKIIFMILSILAVNMGIILIGRYNQTSIVFIFPLFFTLIAYLLNNLNKKISIFVTTLLCLILSANTVYNAASYSKDMYKGYLAEISKVVCKDDNVLANLNCDFYFENGRLHDYRNLAYLKQTGISFEQYIRLNNIKYIIYSEELDLIYNERPRWNGIYGNPAYYDDMHIFLKENSILVHEFANKTYGIRIARYINKKDWKISIYKVIDIYP